MKCICFYGVDRDLIYVWPLVHHLLEMFPPVITKLYRAAVRIILRLFSCCFTVADSHSTNFRPAWRGRPWSRSRSTRKVSGMPSHRIQWRQQPQITVTHLPFYKVPPLKLAYSKMFVCRLSTRSVQSSSVAYRSQSEARRSGVYLIQFGINLIMSQFPLKLRSFCFVAPIFSIAKNPSRGSNFSARSCPWIIMMMRWMEARQGPINKMSVHFLSRRWNATLVLTVHHTPQNTSHLNLLSQTSSSWKTNRV